MCGDACWESKSKLDSRCWIKNRVRRRIHTFSGGPIKSEFDYFTSEATLTKFRAGYYGKQRFLQPLTKIRTSLSAVDPVRCSRPQVEVQGLKVRFYLKGNSLIICHYSHVLLLLLPSENAETISLDAFCRVISSQPAHICQSSTTE